MASIHFYVQIIIKIPRNSSVAVHSFSLANDDGSLLLDENNLKETPLSGNIRDTIQKVRKIVKLFKKSPTKNDVLQNNVRIQFSIEKALILDSKTRWNSLLTMLEKFNEIGECVKKTL